MFRSLSWTRGLPALFLLAVSPAVVQAQFAGLLHRVPQRANAIVMLNMEKIYDSPLAQKENWRLQREKIHAAGLTLIPPNTSQFVKAAQLDFEFMRSLWEVSLLNLENDVSTVEIAAGQNGQIDRIDERSAVLLPIDAYLVQFAKRTVGIRRPANRQNVANWLRQTDKTSARPDLSPYLSESASFAEKGGTPIIMALDLQDVISPEIIRAEFDQMESLKGQDIDADQLADAMASIKGVTLGITVRERVVGSIKVDFEKDVRFLEKVAKPLLLEVLAKNSVMIDEFQQWEPRIAANQIRLNGTLGRSGMMRLSSLFAAPPSLEKEKPASPSESGQPQDADSLQKLSSQQYFKSVAELVDDLKQKPDTTGVKTLGQVGAWYGKYARRIDELPLLNVDPELLDYGAFVASALRQGEASFRGSGGRSRVQQLNVPTQYNVRGGVRGGVGRWGAYGGYGAVAYQEDLRAMQSERTRIRTTERVNTAATGRDVMQQIAEATADIRRKMTQKYQVEF